jgi:hypothetical protein
LTIRFGRIFVRHSKGRGIFYPSLAAKVQCLLHLQAALQPLRHCTGGPRLLPLPHNSQTRGVRSISLMVGFGRIFVRHSEGRRIFYPSRAAKVQCSLHLPDGAAILVACLIADWIFVLSIMAIGLFIQHGARTAGTAAAILAVPSKLWMVAGKRSSADLIL